MKKLLLSLICIFGLFTVTACGEVGIPEQECKPCLNGENGHDGKPGENGHDGKPGENGHEGKPGENGHDGKPGENGLTPFIGENGNWWIGETDTNIKATGHKGDAGSDGLSAYQLYIKNNPNYSKTEKQWIDDVVSGRLYDEQHIVKYIPELKYQIVNGEKLNLPENINVTLKDGTEISKNILWNEDDFSSAFLGNNTIYGTIDGYDYSIKCNVRVINYNTNDMYIDGYINGILANDDINVTLYNNNYIKTISPSYDGYYCFNDLAEGEYYVKVDAPGYYASDVIKTSINNVTKEFNSKYSNIKHINYNLVDIKAPGYYYEWSIDPNKEIIETSAHVNTKPKLEFIDTNEEIVDLGYASLLREKYNVGLINGEIDWSTETINRFYSLYTSLPELVTNDLKTTWKLTNEHINNDVTILEDKGVFNITLSIDAIKNATPRVALLDGQKGKYFSNRLYNAIIRVVTNEGKNAQKCETILNNNFLTSFNCPDINKLTKDTTNEGPEKFQEFLPDEKLLILTMFEEMPQGFHKMKELKYLVRRKTGHTHPIYPDAAAVTWTTANEPYIEFMDSTFIDDQGYFHAKRLIIHEKTHMFWEYYFSPELKKKWCEIGGWYKNPDDPDGWSTTKMTEFVSAYAHGINPNEDMAETVAFYVTDPEKLKSRSMEKYNFVKNYIMQGKQYQIQIQEEMTFEVFNLDPDYYYPGKIEKIKVSVKGEPYEDKIVNLDIFLHSDNKYQGASKFYARFKPTDNKVKQLYDVRGSSVNPEGTHLQAKFIMSKYSYNGYWFTDNIEITDKVGNERYESNTDFGLKLFLDNPLEDLEKPTYVKGSMNLTLENANNEKHPDAQYVIVKFKVKENIEIERVLVRIVALSKNKESIDIDANLDDVNQETGDVTVRIFIPEHYSNGTYKVEEVSIYDKAGNNNFYHVSYGELVGEKNTIEVTTPNPDTNGPELDVNNIGLSAVPTKPDHPDGETKVTLKLKVKDDISGVDNGYIRFLDPQGNQHGYWIYFGKHYTNNIESNYYFNGDPTIEKEYTFVITLPKGSAPGTWGVYEIALTDFALNTSVYNFTEIVHFDVSQ